MTTVAGVVWYLIVLLNTTSQVSYTGPYSYESCMSKADDAARKGAVYAYCTPERN